ncbi:MAG: hypothetical protein LBJ18_03570 [Rickettsiales bacterium]|jgi:hypothetical protein|nr:hypothetical protein [Rickettsiales bacterium]
MMETKIFVNGKEIKDEKPIFCNYENCDIPQYANKFGKVEINATTDSPTGPRALNITVPKNISADAVSMEAIVSCRLCHSRQAR